MKRLLVLDLWHGDDPQKEVIEWVEAFKKSPSVDGIFKVKCHNGNIVESYWTKGIWIKKNHDEDSPITH